MHTFHIYLLCTRTYVSISCSYVHTVCELLSSMYGETSLNRTLRNLEPSLNWTCFQVLLSILAVHIEPLLSVHLPKPNFFFGPKGVQFREVTLYLHTYIRTYMDTHVLSSVYTCIHTYVHTMYGHTSHTVTCYCIFDTQYPCPPPLWIVCLSLLFLFT